MKFLTKIWQRIKGISLRSLVFFFIIWMFMYILIEGMSFALLKSIIVKNTVIDYNDSHKLLDKFPAQIRLSPKEVRETFPRALPLKRTGNYISFPFEPVLGFHRQDALEWYGKKQENLKQQFIILTFGGSTTVQDNWPKYLLKYAKIENIKEDIAILNAGHWGYMSFLEKIYFTSSILPMLQRQNLKPDLVLSMDGVNDIWARIMGYKESVTQGSPKWYSQYHSYHQTLDTDMRRLSTVYSSAQQFLSTIARKGYQSIIHFGSPICPYTLKLTLELLRMRLQNATPVSGTLSSHAQVERLAPHVENTIINAYQTSLLDFFGVTEARNIRFIAYLQPVLLEAYYPHPIPKSFYYPSFDCFGLNFFRENRHWSRIPDNLVIKTDPIYRKAESMYEDLNQSFPGSFNNLTRLFYHEKKADSIYEKDAVHYQQKGKELIAHAVIKDLLSKRILTRDMGSTL